MALLQEACKHGKLVNELRVMSTIMWLAGFTLVDGCQEGCVGTPLLKS